MRNNKNRFKSMCSLLTVFFITEIYACSLEKENQVTGAEKPSLVCEDKTPESVGLIARAKPTMSFYDMDWKKDVSYESCLNNENHCGKFWQKGNPFYEEVTLESLSYMRREVEDIGLDKVFEIGFSRIRGREEKPLRIGLCGVHVVAYDQLGITIAEKPTLHLQKLSIWQEGGWIPFILEHSQVGNDVDYRTCVWGRPHNFLEVGQHRLRFLARFNTSEEALSVETIYSQISFNFIVEEITEY